MSKIPLAEQIEAVATLIYVSGDVDWLDKEDTTFRAILKTLEWMQANEPDIRAYIKARARAKEHPAVKNVLEVFPEAQIEGVGEAD